MQIYKFFDHNLTTILDWIPPVFHPSNLRCSVFYSSADIVSRKPILNQNFVGNKKSKVQIVQIVHIFWNFLRSQIFSKFRRILRAIFFLGKGLFIARDFFARSGFFRQINYSSEDFFRKSRPSPRVYLDLFLFG
jgi:hypothetical protein